MNHFPDFPHQIVQQHNELNTWVLHHYDNYDAWYEHIRDIIGHGNIYDKYEDLNREQCLEKIVGYQQDIVRFSEFLNPWSYSIVSRQIKIDLLYHRFSVLCTAERVQNDKENSKKKVVINKDLSISLV